MVAKWVVTVLKIWFIFFSLVYYDYSGKLNWLLYVFYMSRYLCIPFTKMHTQVRCASSLFVLQWRHNGSNGVSNHQPHDCLLNRLFSNRWKKHRSSSSLASVRGIHRWPVISPHKGPVTRKMFQFDDIIMINYHGMFRVAVQGTHVEQYPWNSFLLYC